MKRCLALSLVIVLASAPAFAAASVAQGPDEAVMTVVRGLSDNRPEVIWQALPASYQADLTELIQGAAQRMDADLWVGAFEVLQKASRVLGDKREFVFQNPIVSARLQENPEAFENWDSLVGLLDTMAYSELSDPRLMQTVDPERFLAGTGSRLMRQAEKLTPRVNGPSFRDEIHGKLGGLQATVASQDGDRAIVAIHAPGEGSKEVEFLRVEGKWIPKEMAEEWPEAMEEGRRGLLRLEEEEAFRHKDNLISLLGSVSSGLDNLLEAATSEQFDAALQSMIGAVMIQAMSLSSHGD